MLSNNCDMTNYMKKNLQGYTRLFMYFPIKSWLHLNTVYVTVYIYFLLCWLAAVLCLPIQLRDIFLFDISIHWIFRF